MQAPGHFGSSVSLLLQNLAWWKHFLPPSWLVKFVKYANTVLQDDPIDKNYRKTTDAEVEVILGETLAASITVLRHASPS